MVLCSSPLPTESLQISSEHWSSDILPLSVAHLDETCHRRRVEVLCRHPFLCNRMIQRSTLWTQPALAGLSTRLYTIACRQSWLGAEHCTSLRVYHQRKRVIPELCYR